MTITPNVEPTILQDHSSGAIDKYTSQELDQISIVRQAGRAVSNAEKEFRYEIVRLKLMLDSQDQADGLSPGNTRGGSRFWDGARDGDFGPELLTMAENGNRMTVTRWIEANEAASKLLGSSVTRVTLPFQAASEQGIEQSTLTKYGKLGDDERETADLYFEVNQTLKGDFVQAITTLHNNYPELVDEFREGILGGKYKYREQVRDYMDERQKQIEILEAEEKAREAALALLAAEDNEDEAENYEPEVTSDEHVGDQDENIAARKSPSKSWYQSPNGKKKVEEVVGDLASPLPGLIDNLAELSKRLDDQFSHSSVMHNYSEFWAGYDKFYYSDSTARVKWGRGGRLARMKKLKSLMSELSGKLGVYISASTPPENIEYPEE